MGSQKAAASAAKAFDNVDDTSGGGGSELEGVG